MYDPNLIVTINNRHLVVGSLVSAGHSAAELQEMTMVQLTNFYHEAQPDTSVLQPEASSIQRLAAEIVVETIKHVQHHGATDEQTVRFLARQEALELFNLKLKELHVPRELIVTSPTSQVHLTGLVHYMTESVIQVLSLAHPVLMVGPAGCGKTTIAEHAARALNLPFYITSTTNDTHELMGFIDGYGNYHNTPFRTAFEHGGVWVADEIDAWDASALLAVNSALANGYAMFPDSKDPVRRHANFRVAATANTFGTGADRVYVGRNELDAASLDRFAVLEVDYDLTLERAFANGQDTWLDYVWRIRRMVNEKNIRHVVSSRAIGNGAAALNAGLNYNNVKEWYLFKGMSAKDRSKLDDKKY